MDSQAYGMCRESSTHVPVDTRDGSMGTAATDGDIVCYQIQVREQSKHSGSEPAALFPCLFPLHASGHFSLMRIIRGDPPAHAAAPSLCA